MNSFVSYFCKSSEPMFKVTSEMSFLIDEVDYFNHFYFYTFWKWLFFQKVI